MQKTPPEYKKEPFVRKFFNDEFIDNYEWVRDKDNSEVIDILNQENEYIDYKLQNLTDLRKSIFNEIKSRTKETDLSVPSRHKGYWYWARTEKGKNYAITCRLKIDDLDNYIPPKIKPDQKLTGEEIIFDANKEAKRFGDKFFSLGSTDISNDSKLMLYSVDIKGDERYDVYLRNLETNEDKLIIEQISSSASFDPSGKFVFYTEVDDAWRPHKLMRHKIGTSYHDDVLVYQEDDEAYNVSFGVSADEKTLFLLCSSNDTDEIRMLESKNPEGEFTLFSPEFSRKKEVEYAIEPYFCNNKQYYFITHNRNNLNFDIDLYDENKKFLGRILSSESKVDGSSIQINTPSAYQNFILFSIKKEIINRVYIVKVEDFIKDPLNCFKNAEELLPKLDFENNSLLYSLGAGASEYESPVINYSFLSYIHPPVLISRNITTSEEVLLREKEVLPNTDGSKYSSLDYCQKLMWCENNGVKIPVTLVWKKSFYGDNLPQNAPILQYAYGSYGHSLKPSFSISRLSLLDRGIVYVIAHVRGGQECGKGWYLDGKLQNKRNTFDDFIAVTNYLITQSIANKHKIVANGGSAGGLLMGVLVNQAPDLYAGIEADVPFVDNLTTILKPELPLTITEWDEWGNPLANQDDYEYIKSYSPYENIQKNTNDNLQIFITSSINDTRVLYVEPMKWCAKLREYGHDVLMKMEMISGHAGNSGRYKVWEDIAFELSWIVNCIK